MSFQRVIPCVILILSGSLLVYTGFKPQQETLEDFKQRMNSFEPIKNGLKGITESLPKPITSNIESLISFALYLKAKIRQYGGTAVIIGAIVAFIPLRLTKEIGGHVIMIASRTGGIFVVIPIILLISNAIWYRHFDLFNNHLLWLGTTIQGIGVFLAFIGGLLLKVTE